MYMDKAMQEIYRLQMENIKCQLRILTRIGAVPVYEDDEDDEENKLDDLRRLRAARSHPILQS